MSEAINNIEGLDPDIKLMALSAHSRALSKGSGIVTVVFPKHEEPFVRVSVGPTGPIRFSTV